MFDTFPLNWYPAFKNDSRELQTNITRTVTLDVGNLPLDTLYLSNNQNLFSVAYTLYKEYKYWVVLAILNNVLDPSNVFLDDNSFEEYIDTLEGNPRQDILHYLYPDNSATTLESIRTLIEKDNMLSDLQVIQKYNLRAITRYDVLMLRNEELRKIKVPHSSIIEDLYRKIERQLQDF